MSTERVPVTDMQCIAALLPASLALRPMTPADLPFMLEVYAGTRAAELAQVAWSDAQKRQFVEMQFSAQHAFYQEQYPTAAFHVVLQQQQPVGRLFLDRWPGELRIVDIALLPAVRGRGIGTTLLRAVLEEGRRLQLPVTIHVEIFNPAQRLYARLGFQKIEDKGVYHLMEKRPDA